MPIQDSLKSLLDESLARLHAVQDEKSLDEVRVHYLGKKGAFTELLKNLATVSAEEKPALGALINVARDTFQQALQQKQIAFKEAQLQKALESERIDVSLPGRSKFEGSLHPVTLARRRLHRIFARMGFDRATGPEIEDDYHNFSALNIAENHPARAMQDTLYFPSGLLLRTQTSPVQIRYMEQHQPPIRIIAAGRVYRNEFDLTHTPMFHQVEGLWVDEHLSFADLKGVLTAFFTAFFGARLSLRLRPSYFPFTEPSAEMDIECVGCAGKGCRICKQSGWLEVGGCGMVHPQVLANVNIDSERYSGFAFGLGLDRLAMLYYRIDDLRVLFENDIRFLEQFSL